MAVRQQRHGELHRQTIGRSVHLVAKGELVQDDVVGGAELAIGQNHIANVNAEFAALDAIACVFHGIG